MLIHYTVQAGDTLSGIAAFYGTPSEMLVAFNKLQDADQLAVGQVLTVPVNYGRQGPSDVLIPDSELVYGPSFVDFNVIAATSVYTGYFATYTERVLDGEVLSAVEIVQKISEQFSVGPRVLLALLELRGGWLTNAEPSEDARRFPLGYRRAYSQEGLFAQLSQAANALNAGFGAWRWDDGWLLMLDDGEYVQYSASLNAGTAGVQRALAIGAENYEAWVADLSATEGFPAVYRRLFGDPFDYAVEPLIPYDLQAPNLSLPWPQGETWYFTGAPHPGWGALGTWSALDFATDERNLGCQVSERWVTAAAPGRIVVSERGIVWQDLDDDGFLGTGWTLLYLHLAEGDRVAAGTYVQRGDRLGHPSCEGGISTASHLHFAWRYNGVWMPVDDPACPMSLSGWHAVAGPAAYDGIIEKGQVTKEACECWSDINAVLH
jgi:murein DD-endopeptidase MepM/ murein hydrolase activator NlpD